MQVFSRLADAMIASARRTPYFPLLGYMERFWLFRVGRAKPDEHDGGVAGEDRRAHRWLGARVHHILRSDKGVAFHDHPWNYMTLILKDGYYEVVPVLDPNGTVTDVLVRNARAWHRIELPEGRTAWTLFLMGPSRQTWGFLTRFGKVEWRVFLWRRENPRV